MAKTVTTISTELADREAIRDCLVLYCRGIDRRDADLLRQVYWPDGSDDHAMMPPMGAEEFIKMVEDGTRSQDLLATQHMLGNILIDVVGTVAYVESYVQAYHRSRRPNGDLYDLIAGARYLDRMEKRDDEWRIFRRVVQIDWLREYEDSADLEKGFEGVLFVPGGHKPTDASYQLLTHGS